MHFSNPFYAESQQEAIHLQGMGVMVVKKLLSKLLKQ